MESPEASQAPAKVKTLAASDRRVVEGGSLGKSSGAPPAFLFIVGCPRSGTSLVSALLNATGRFAIPIETQFIPLFHRFLFLAGDLQEAKNRRRLIESIFAFLEIWTLRTTPKSASRPHTLLALAQGPAALSEGAGSYPEMVRRLFSDYASARGAQASGDKAVSFFHVPLERLDESTACGARFIHVIRDGRDVALSWMRTGYGPRSVAGTAAVWRQHVTGNRLWGSANRDRYLEVNYEKIIASPRQELPRLCQFAGVPFSPSMLDFHRSGFAASLAGEERHRMVGAPLDASNSAKWKTQMPERDLRQFEAIAGNTLGECGYALSLPGVGGFDRRLLRWQSAWSRFSERFTFCHLRLCLKEVLPAILLLSARFGLDLTRLCNHRRWLQIERRLSSGG